MSALARVIVAHDNESIRAVIVALLCQSGFEASAVADGEACLRLLDASTRADGPPAAIVLDVSIAKVLAFQVIEAARARVPRVPVVLVASIYNRTSYKRRPTSLYGADDYVEQHHIADALVGKLVALVGPAPAAQALPREHAPPLHGGPEDRAVRVAGEAALDTPVPPSPDAALRAQRLARLIVSDIALYNGDAIAAARARGSGGDELDARLRLDLEEGRLLFELRVPQAVRRDRDFIAEALAELIQGPTGERGT